MADAGFTLLEVLAAVAIAGVMLSAIGAVFAVTLAGIRSTRDRVALTTIGRTLVDTLPEGDALKPGTTRGTTGTLTWRIDVTAPPVGNRLSGPSEQPAWRPVAVAIEARTAAGRVLRLDTVRLARGAAPP